jgi:ElaB/YqjD/DUF883 family membrane-anchored ribosome-binding protein
MGDRGLGTAEVHTGLHSGGTDEYSGLQFAGRESQSGVGGRLRDVADRVGGPVHNLAGNLGPRVSGAAGTVRERASSVAERASTAMEKGGVLSRLRDNPLPVLGVAFAIGFLLASRGDDDDYGETNRGRARSELRDALMAGVTAGLAQGARGFLSQAGSESTGFVNTLMDAFLGGGSGGGGSTGGARSGGGTYGSTGGSASGTARTGRGGSTAGSAGRTGASRPPSHQEY